MDEDVANIEVPTGEESVGLATVLTTVALVVLLAVMVLVICIMVGVIDLWP